MARSVDSYLFVNDEIEMIVFTDQKNIIDGKAESFERVKIQTIEIESLKWPDATLLRYRYYKTINFNIESQYFMHMDADMLVVENSIDSVSDLASITEMALVYHPGYWRPSIKNKIIMYLKQPKFIIKDLLLFIKFGGLGTWSKNPNSLAYVNRKERRGYFCGGVWLGGSNIFKKLVEDLSLMVEIDKSNHILPTWHDESYLNKWASKNEFRKLLPTFCFSTGYKNLINLSPIILAVDKNAKR